MHANRWVASILSGLLVLLPPAIVQGQSVENVTQTTVEKKHSTPIKKLVAGKEVTIKSTCEKWCVGGGVYCKADCNGECFARCSLGGDLGDAQCGCK